MKIPQTIEMQVGALNASEHNQRQITEDDFAELVKSLLLLPKGLYYRPVVVDDRNIALAGNMRLRALKYIHELGLDQLETQSNSGGMTELYLDAGTYVKSFYTVMYCPSCVVVSAMGTAHRRLHHHIKWRYAVPKILHESVKKVTTNGITPKQ